LSDRAGQTQPDLAARFGLLVGDLAARLLNSVNDHARMFDQRLACDGGAHAVGAPQQQHGAKFELHVAHMRAQGGLSDIQDKATP
jgi:hypothetical protein